MTKLEYYKHCIAKQYYLERWWLLATYGILLPDSVIKDTTGTAQIQTDSKGVISVYINDEWVTILEFTPDTPIFGIDTRIELPAGYIGSIPKKITSTYGILVVNLIVFWNPYGSIVEYQNTQLTPSYINDIAYGLLKDHTVDVDTHLVFENSTLTLSVLSTVAVPTATRRSITPNPAIAKLKQELISAPGVDLTDPGTVAAIQNKLIEADYAYLKGDDSANFYITPKSMRVTRLRLNGMYGAEPDFYNESKVSVMVPSLREGWEAKDLPMLNNTIRGGSFSRGASTALGGAEVKTTSRIFQNYNISDTDCKSTHGLSIKVTPIQVKSLVGRYLVGSTTPLTTEKLVQKLGSTIKIRSPATCIVPGTSYCKVCMGDSLIEGMGLNAMATTATSAFLSLFMAMMHTTELSVERYEYKDRIS